MAVLDDMDAKLDQLISLMGEEVNVSPDFLMPGMETHASLPLTINSSVPLSVRFRVEDHDGARCIRMTLRGPNYEILMDRTWRAVFRDPIQPGLVIDRPGIDPRSRI